MTVSEHGDHLIIKFDRIEEVRTFDGMMCTQCAEDHDLDHTVAERVLDKLGVIRRHMEPAGFVPNTFTPDWDIAPTSVMADWVDSDIESIQSSVTPLGSDVWWV